MAEKKKIVILGAGFAGLSVLLGLIKKNLKADITLIDKDEEFEYTPSIHLASQKPQVLNRVRFSLKRYYKKYFVQASVRKITKNSVDTSKGAFAFDYLVIATGSITNYYGNKTFEKNCLPYKRVSDVKEFFKKLPTAKTVSIIGGGYTGVEIASVLANSPFARGKTIQLFHSDPLLLTGLPQKAQNGATAYLLNRGVKLYCGEFVKETTKKHIVLTSGRKIPSDLHLFTAGVKPSDAFGLMEKQDLTAELSSEKYPHIFYCGDAARSGLLTTAHNAMIEGREVARILSQKLNGKEVTHSPHTATSPLALALGMNAGYIVFGNSAFSLPFTGVLKYLIEKRILFEFKRKIRLPL